MEPLRRVDGDCAAKGIDAPGEKRAVGDPLLHLGVEFGERVRGRENLDKEIRREGEKAFLLAVGERQPSGSIQPTRRRGLGWNRRAG